MSSRTAYSSFDTGHCEDTRWIDGRSRDPLSGRFSLSPYAKSPSTADIEGTDGKWSCHGRSDVYAQQIRNEVCPAD